MQHHDFNDLTLSRIAEEAARNAREGKLPRDLIRERLEWVRELPQLPVLMQSKQLEELLDAFQVTAHLSAVEQFFGKRFDDDPNLFHFYFGGVKRIVKEWLLGHCSQSAAEITDSIVSLTFSLAAVVRSG